MEHAQERHGFRVLVQYKVIRLSEIDGQRILDAGHSGLIPFAPLMQRPASVDAVEDTSKWEDWQRDYRLGLILIMPLQRYHRT